jgi:hypothetical protein
VQSSARDTAVYGVDFSLPLDPFSSLFFTYVGKHQYSQNGRLQSSTKNESTGYVSSDKSVSVRYEDIDLSGQSTLLPGTRAWLKSLYPR